MQEAYYAFAENDVIRSIDLDGFEKVIVANAVKYDPGLILSLRVLNNTDVGKQLYTLITDPNKNTKYDVLISKFYNCDAGGQPQPVSIQPDGTSWEGSGVSHAFGLTSIESKEKGIPQGEDPNDYNSFKNGRDIIRIRVLGDASDFINSNLSKGNKLAVKNAVARLAYIIFHEGEFHMKNNINNVNKDARQEHIEGYDDSTLKGDYSPNYEEIKPSSPAGKGKQQIEKSANELIK